MPTHVPLPLAPLAPVLENDCCSGCGACACVAEATMELDDYGAYRPQAVDAQGPEPPDAARVSEACPFLHPELDEDALAAPRFAEHAKYDASLGHHHRIFAAHTIEGAYREHGTSGGVGTWLGDELLRRDLIDGVIHVKPSERSGPDDAFFRYAISRSAEEVRQGAKTRYHVVEVSRVMEEVRRIPGRYLFVGVPCLCKAVRRLQRLDPIINERIVFAAALICGHLKTVHWTRSLAWGGGIHPDRIDKFQYRTKGPGIPARAYVFRAEAGDGRQPEAAQVDAGRVTGGKWNTCAMMLNACDHCDDVVGETADLTIGDAWLPRFTKDPNGHNLLVARNPTISEVLESAAAQGRLFLDPVSAEEAAASQSGGLRHRREGLSYRLQKEMDAGKWVPTKRVAPGSVAVSEERARIYDARSAYAARSKEAFLEALNADEYEIYEQAMRAAEATFVELEIGTTPSRRLLLTVFGERRLRQMLNFRRTVPDRLKKLLKQG